MSYKSDMFEIKKKSIYGQYQFRSDRKSSKPKKLVPGPYSTTWSYISLAYDKNVADEEKILICISKKSL